MKRMGGIAAVAVLALVAGCGKPDPEGQLDAKTRVQRHYVNMFAYNMLNTYYLWRDEVKAMLDRWEDDEEPIAKVAEVRYKDAAGKDVDRWTMLTDDFASLQGGVSGHTRTLGMDFQLYYTDKTHSRIIAVVNFTYADSPAAMAGLRRGDAILTVDGKEMTPKNYQAVVSDGLLGGGTVKLGLDGERSVTLTAVDMYEDPVQTVRILEGPGGKKVGYLHYTSFTLDSCGDLVDVFRHFTEEGIGDLVLDLRYNSGGYVIAENVLASMLAPPAEVEAGSVFSREIYNARLAEELGEDVTRFDTGFVFKVNGNLRVVSTVGANPDLPRLYVLTTDASASASESLVCGLRPYMDVILVGAQTSGKYCAGFLLEAKDWYDDVKKSLEEGEYDKALPHVDNWGIYVMYARYADCNGLTLSMPDGIAPDVEAEDDPTEGIALGDPCETMLSTALDLISGRTRASAGRTAPSLEPVPEGFHPRNQAILVGRY